MHASRKQYKRAGRPLSFLKKDVGLQTNDDEACNAIIATIHDYWAHSEMLKLFAQGIKSISHGQYVDLGSKLTFLVGPNSAGKSTVVEVLRMLNAELKNWKVRSEHRVFESHELPLAGLPSRSVHQVNSSPRRVSAISTVGLAAESRGMRCELHFSASRTSSGSIQDFRALYDDIDEGDIHEPGDRFVTYIENDRLCFLEQYSATDYLAGLIARNISDGVEHVMSNKYKFSRQYVLLIDDDAELIYFAEWIDRLMTDRNIERKAYFVKNFFESQDSRYLRFSYNILLGFIKSIFSGPERQREINKLDKLNSKILRRVKEIKAKFGFFSDLLAEPKVVDPVRSLPAQDERVKIINLLEDDDVSGYEALLRSGARKVWGETANAIRSPEAEEEVYLNDTLLDDVNRALSEHLFIDQGYQVAVDARLLIGKDELHEAIDAFDIGDIIVSSLECYSEMSLVDSHGRRLAFDEVGSGIGYVLPALISSHSWEKIVVLQQPELHLHPALQAALTDVLIEALGDNNKKIICETHSEHMILRALRRVRQTTAGKLIDQQLALSSDDVMVNYFEPKIGGGTKIYPLRVSEDGDFVDRWPHGFFSERDQELFDE